MVGATPATTEQAGAPLRLAGFRTVSTRDIHYGVGTSAPYGALEAFEQNGRNLLLLGGWAPDTAGAEATPGTLQASLTGYIQQPGGWSSLYRNLLVTQTTGNPVLLDSNAITP